MPKFIENIKTGVKKVSNIIAKKFVDVSIMGDSLEFVLPPTLHNQIVEQYLEDLVIKVDDLIVFDHTTYPYDYDVKLNENLYLNKNISEIHDKPLKMGDRLALIVPNRPNVSKGIHNIVIATHSAGVKTKFRKYFSIAPEKMEITTPQIARVVGYIECKNCGKQSTDPNQVICEYCGSDLK